VLESVEGGPGSENEAVKEEEEEGDEGDDDEDIARVDSRQTEEDGGEGEGEGEGGEIVDVIYVLLITP
jgi:hypothetical protein